MNFTMSSGTNDIYKIIALNIRYVIETEIIYLVDVMYLKYLSLHFPFMWI